MTDLLTQLQTTRRPRLLLRAARLGAMDYRRERDLCRIAHTATLPAPQTALHLLLAEEEKWETLRQAGDATYRLTRHVELLIAIMGEARFLPHTAPV